MGQESKLLRYLLLLGSCVMKSWSFLFWSGHSFQNFPNIVLPYWVAKIFTVQKHLLNANEQLFSAKNFLFIAFETGKY